MDKLNIDVDVIEIKKSVNEFLRDSVKKILTGAIDLDRLKRDAETVLSKKSYFEGPKIIEVIEEQCEWALGLAVREAIEDQGFKNHVSSIAAEIMKEDEFNTELKAKIRESLLKRV